jgi:ribulose-5-phosphate 4-epimerase/fuculose-1-phosphate aldolase
VEESAYYGIGPVRTSSAAPAGTDALAAAAAEALGDGKAVLLGGHGVIALGRDVAEATIIARSVEHQATIAWLLRLNAGR